MRDDNGLLSTLDPALDAGGDGMSSNYSPEKVFGLGWFEVDQPSFQRSSKNKGGVPNCGVCMSTGTSGTLHSLPPELFEGLAPRTKLTLTLGEGDPGVTFEWSPDDKASQRVQLPQGWSPPPLATCVYLVIPGHDFSVPVPIVRREISLPRRATSATTSSSPSAKVA